MNTKLIKNNGGQIAYEDLGSGGGTPVICVPSMGDLRSEYRFLSPQLQQAGLRPLCMDVRGHGESSTVWDDFSVAGVGRDLLELARSLKAGPVLVVGTSMAAGAAVWAAAEAPELFKGLALIGPFVRGETSSASRLLYSLMFSRPWGPAMWLMYYKTLYPSRKPADFEAYTAVLKANLTQPGRLEALQKMLSASKSASEARLGNVKAPVLVVMGSKDPDFKQPEVEARWVAGQLHAELSLIDGAGHYPHAEMPEITGPKIVEFLCRVNS